MTSIQKEKLTRPLPIGIMWAMRGSDLSILMPEIEWLKQALSAVGISSRITMFDPEDNHSVLKFEKNVLYLVIDHKPERNVPPYTREVWVLLPNRETVA
jgi:hypothetical protein